MDGRKAQPQSGEVYQWKKNDDQFLYLKQILKLSKNDTFTQNSLQNLIWNLKNNTYWEQYPTDQKKILKLIDPESALKLPSQMKLQIQKKFLEQVQPDLSQKVRDSIELIQGTYHSYEDFEQSLNNTQSSFQVPLSSLSSIDGTSLYVETQLQNYKSQEVTVYNVTDENQSLNIFDYYQQPYRQDVQPLAAFSDLDNHEFLFNELEKLLFEDMLKAGIGFTPVLGDLIDLYEASSGKNFFKNEWLTSDERFMSAMGVLAGNGPAYRYAKKVFHSPTSYVRDVQSKYRKVKDLESYKGLEKLSRDVQAKGIPDDWKVKVTRPKGNQGLEYTHPNNENIKVRVMPGNPKAVFENSKHPYVVVTKSADYLNKNGQVVNKNSSEAHISLDEFDFTRIEWD